VAENPRIEELRRRVQKDPASIAFAQLAEEYRRSGNYEEAIAICRTGLQTHPSYLSARVTLGRALLEMNDLDNAEGELRYVLQHAAENLAAIRAMAEIHHRRGELSEALGFYKSALELARHDPDLEQTVEEISRTISKASAPTPQVVPEPVVNASMAPNGSPRLDPQVESPALTPDQATAEFLKNTFDLLELDPLDLEPAPAEPVVMEQAAPPTEPIQHTEPIQLMEPVPAMEPVQANEPIQLMERIEAVEPAQVMESAQDDDFMSVEIPIEMPFEMDMPLEAPMIVNPALAGLERFLGAIHSYRQRRAV
jgi:tetratricopeptide (TPR) repeat protein